MGSHLMEIDKSIDCLYGRLFVWYDGSVAAYRLDSYNYRDIYNILG